MSPADTAELAGRDGRRLFGVAYRLLGTVADAEDAVQETFLRWEQADQAAIERPRGWLTTVLTRHCLDLLRSAPDIDHPGQSLVPIPGSPPSLTSPPSGCRFHPRCQFAEDDCKVSDPPLRLLEGDRATACLHYERCLDQIGADS